MPDHATKWLSRTALSFAARDLYRANPYPETDLGEGFGFEDWAWNMRTIGRGIIHKIVPGTGHVIRRKPSQSLAKHTSLADAVPPPSRYMERFIGARRIPPAGEAIERVEQGRASESDRPTCP